MNQQRLLMFGGALAVAAFLLGFVPQYVKSRSLEAQLGTLRQEVAAERDKLQMDDLALQVGRVYLETTQKNYGLASQSSTKFFDRVRAMTAQESDPNRKAFFQKALAGRDAITAGLAKADPGTLVAVQDLFQRAIEVSQSAAR